MGMRKTFVYTLLLAFSLGVHAQDTTAVKTDSTARHSVAIFVPLYLDSAFDAGGNYRYDKGFPKFFNPGLEFYEGAQMALDTLDKEQVKLDVQVYDTRNVKLSLQQELDDSAMQRVGLIIGQVSNTAELQQLAAAAA